MDGVDSEDVEVLETSTFSIAKKYRTFSTPPAITRYYPTRDYEVPLPGDVQHKKKVWSLFF